MRRGFTLIELLATTALAALLLVAGFKVIAALGRTRATLARQEAQRSFAPEVLNLLRADLTNARYMKSRPAELTLTGYCGVDAVTLAPNHRPVSVRYHLAAVADRNWLVRDQTDLDVPTNRNVWSALVCSGIESFDVRPAAEPDDQVARRSVQPAPPRQRASRSDRTGWDGPDSGLDQPYDQANVPAGVRVVLRTGNGADAAVVDQVVFTR
jgi:prepilin-type N-terminal cleavage/methylation domain-containing protein